MFPKIISIISSPFLITPLFGLLITRSYSKTPSDFLLFGSSFILLVVILPFVFVYLGVKSHKITDLHVKVREQRSGPFLISILGAILLIIAYHFEKPPTQGMEMAIILLANAIVFYLITKFSKASIHSAAFFGSVLIASMFIDLRILIFLVFLPLIIWARMKRKRHTFWQAFYPVIIVATITLLVFYLLRI